jgi:hypothetical protein
VIGRSRSDWHEDAHRGGDSENDSGALHRVLLSFVGGLFTICPEARGRKHGPKRENHLALNARAPELN